MTENDVLGFDPSQLSVFATNDDSQRNAGNPLVYRTRPADSKSEDGIYRSTIKIIYNPFDLKHSVLEQQAYWMQDSEGGFLAVSSLTNNDKSCPIFTAWKKCHFAEAGSVLELQARTTDKGGKGLFDKRYNRYVTIQVISDKNQPELEGKYMFWKLPKSIWDIIDAKMNPAKEDNVAPVPVMDFLFGRTLALKVTPGPDDKAHPERKTRETKYTGTLSSSTVSCTNPDGSSLLNSAEQAVLDAYVREMSKYWDSTDADERASILARVNADANTAEFRQIYARVLNEIKSFCPNLNDELGFKPWDEKTTARVQKWIDVVLSGNNPAQAADAPATLPADAPVTAPVATSSATVEVSTPGFGGADDDLPF